MTERRATIYARLSKDPAGTGAGVDRQLQDARRLAHLRGLVVVSEHTDNDMSAAGSRRRPGFEAMLVDVKDKRAGVIIAWAWDRLSRNRADTLRLIETCQQAHATVALVRGSDIDMSTASGRLVADLLAGVSRAEIDAKSERQRRAGLQRAEAGKPPARRAFGYQQDGTPHPAEAPLVTSMFALFLTGATMTGIARQLNSDGWTTTRGKQWDDTTVRQALVNPRYKGERWYHGERKGAGDWQPLVTEETFEAVRAALDGRKKRRPARKHLGGALFTCWCGSVVRVSYAKGGARTYHCAARAHMQRLAEAVDEVVYRVIAERLRRADLGRLLAEDRHTADVASLRHEAVGLRGRVDALAGDYADGKLTGRQVQIATRRIQAKLEAVERTLAEAGRVSAVAAVAAAPDPGDAWLGLPLDRQRAVLDALATVVIQPGKVGRGRFDPETVTFDWRTP